jgi:hypothetical protein
MQDLAPLTVLISYYPKHDTADDLLQLIEMHWPILDLLGLVSNIPVQIWLASDQGTGRRFYLEMFQWKDAQAAEVANRAPEVQHLQEAMEPLLEERRITSVDLLRPAVKLA